MIASLLTQLGLPVLISIVAESLGRINHPAAKGAAKSLADVQDLLATGGINPEQLAEANRHIETMAELEAEKFEAATTQVNESLRAEIASTDPYVRRMRPTFGYLIAATWAAQMFAVAYIIVFRTEKAYLILEAMESLGTIWAVGLSVLGIYVYKRSEDKKVLKSTSALPQGYLNP